MLQKKIDLDEYFEYLKQTMVCGDVLHVDIADEDTDYYLREFTLVNEFGETISSYSELTGNLVY